MRAFGCYKVNYIVVFDTEAGQRVKSTTMEPTHSRSSTDCDSCRADYQSITTKYPVGTNATCYYDPSDPAGTVQLELIKSSAGDIVLYICLAVGIGVIFGGIGLVITAMLCCANGSTFCDQLRYVITCRCLCKNDDERCAYEYMHDRYDDEEPTLLEADPPAQDLPGGGYVHVYTASSDDHLHQASARHA